MIITILTLPDKIKNTIKQNQEKSEQETFLP